MSILIRGMDYIPPRKPDRVYLVYHFDDEIGSFSHSICVTDKLIELPPHGRLISADLLKEEISGNVKALVKAIIDEVPTIIPEDNIVPTIIPASEEG